MYYFSRYRPIAPELSFYSVYKQKMAVARRAHVPPTPNGLVELGEMVQEYRPLRHLYQGTVLGDDGSQAVLFMHEDMREPLSQCKQLYADGTFKVRIHSIGKAGRMANLTGNYDEKTRSFTGPS